MNAHILCAGALKESWQRDACREYLKRLARYGKYSIEEVPDEPEPASLSQALITRAIDKEGYALMARLRPRDRVIAMDARGQALSSEELAARAAAWAQDGRRTVFVIGGSCGLSENVLARADMRLSLSNMTFPHALARVILLEQLYRAERITRGERYHK